MQRDEIHIEEFEVEARIGVPDAERQQPQRLVILISMVPRNDFHALADDLQRTVDYAKVAAEVQSFATAQVVKLIETFADELAAHLLALFELDEVRLEIRKFILADAKYVAVRVTRAADAGHRKPRSG